MKKIAIFTIIVLSFAACGNKNKAADPKTQTPEKPTTTTAENGGGGKTFTESDLRFHKKPVILTKHARCRMGCRHIDASEIQEMLTNGVVNAKKSGQSKDEKTCPTQAIEGKTHDNQTVRIVVAECDTKAKIVTVIDLKNDFKCTCE